MRKSWTVAVGLILAICLAHAGAGKKEKDRHYCGVCWLLFYDKGISEELKLSPKQLEKAKQVANEITDKYQEKLDKTRRQTKGDSSVSGRYFETSKVAERETNKALAKVLTATQMKRLEQIHKQAYFYSDIGILDPKNAKVLKLTRKQREVLTKFSGQADPKMSVAEEKEWVDKGFAVLTAEQKKAWETIVGPRYTFRR
jgi:hypothetical protein